METKFVRWHPQGKKIWLYPGPEKRSKVRDVRWGDVLNIVEARADGWSQIKWGSKTYYIRTEETTDTRPLEVLFVDVGQGDGAILTSAETGEQERIILIDAGKTSNMAGLIKWRFGKLKPRFDFEGAVITHPDLDHYGGFQALFSDPKFGFRHVWHNGLLERTGDDLLGSTDASGRYLTDLALDNDAAHALYVDPEMRGGKRYPKLIWTALETDRIGPVEMLAVGHGAQAGGRTYLPGFAPTDPGDADVRVIGPVPERKAGQSTLRWFGNDIGSGAKNAGKTKNGHSVLLKLDIGMFSLLFGGDLNRPAEDYLLRHYGGITNIATPLSDAVREARRTLRADMLKCCHHGASDVTDEFLEAVEAFAYVVSSGDEESHAHPRPDLLGRLGKHGRGDAPMIFCTEILRSTRESGVKADFTRLARLDRDIQALNAQIDAVEEGGTDALDLRQAQKDKIQGRRELQKKLQKRNVGVYGAITLRTDGRRMDISFMLEKPRGKQRWQSFRLVHDPATEEWYTADDGGH